MTHIPYSEESRMGSQPDPASRLTRGALEQLDMRPPDIPGPSSSPAYEGNDYYTSNKKPGGGYSNLAEFMNRNKALDGPVGNDPYAQSPQM